MQDLLESTTLQAVMHRLSAGGDFPREGECEVMRLLAQELGLDGLPTILSQERFAAHPGVVLNRGVDRVEWVESYLSGPYRVTYGLHGEGVYAVGDGDSERAAKVARAFGAHVFRLKWAHGAVIGEIEELSKAAEDYRDDVLAKLHVDQKVGVDLIQGVERLLDDIGCFAIIAGFDGWHSEALAYDNQNVKYFVIANRGATVAEETVL